MMHIQTQRGQECPICEQILEGPESSYHTCTHTSPHPPKSQDRFTGPGHFKCKYCDRTFKARPSCLRHEKVHLAPRAHVCDVCDAGFHRRDMLLRHMRIHLKRDAQTTQSNCFHKCFMCHKTFYRKDMYQNHLRVHQKRLAAK